MGLIEIHPEETRRIVVPLGLSIFLLLSPPFLSASKRAAASSCAAARALLLLASSVAAAEAAAEGACCRGRNARLPSMLACVHTDWVSRSIDDAC